MNNFFISRDRCPCCESSEFLELSRASYVQAPLRDYLVSFYSPQGGVEFDYLEDQDWILVKCLGCELIYQREIPNEFLMHKLYDEWINPKKEFVLHEENKTIDCFAELGWETYRIVKTFGRPPQQVHCLDFSMGWGHWCRIAAAFGCTVHGTEFGAARAAHAKETGVNVIDYNEIPGFRYDYIRAEQVFEHLPNPRQTLAYLTRSLNEGGVLMIGVPNGGDIMERLKTPDWRALKGTSGSLNAVAPLEHINCFNRSSLLRLTGELGLVPFEIPSSGFSQRAKGILRPYWHRLLGRQTGEALPRLFKMG